MQPAEPTIPVKRAKPGIKCRRQTRLDPAGVPVYCPSDATLTINGVDYCRVHADEAMQVELIKQKNKGQRG